MFKQIIGLMPETASTYITSCTKAALVGMFSLAASSASAVVINFDEYNGFGTGYWEESQFLFSPAKSDNDVKCYISRCLMEIGQGELTTMTYDEDAVGPHGGGTGANAVPAEEVEEHYGDEFNLDFFYFVLVGQGEEQENNLTVTGTFADGSTVTATFIIHTDTGEVEVREYNSDGDLIDDSGVAIVSFATDENSNHNDTDDGTIQYNVGYWVDLGDEWHGIVDATWTLNTFDTNGNRVLSAQARLDCVGAFESGTGAESGCSPGGEIPIPASLPMLLAGLGGLGILYRRRRTA